MWYSVRNNEQPSFSLKLIAIIIISIVLVALSTLTSEAQNYKKDNKRFYKSYYKRQSNWYANTCDRLERKRQKQSNIRVHAGSHYKPRPAAEIDDSEKLARATVTKSEQKPTSKPVSTPDPVSKPLPVTPKIEEISPEKLVELHKKEEEVLAENHLPQPTSKQQEHVRKIVADKLASKTNVYPLSLSPLYFNFAQDEFSVVDMEPFLIAAEYALQGRTVLIEGHTDSRGADDYNVKLSIKRVQKIRQLMLDMGVPDDRISIIGYGEEIRSNTNKTNQGRELNRRVDFTIF
jgi:outer membrane protein OmpA-like peptidoglycan-associated protein